MVCFLKVRRAAILVLVAILVVGVSASFLKAYPRLGIVAVTPVLENSVTIELDGFGQLNLKTVHVQLTSPSPTAGVMWQAEMPIDVLQGVCCGNMSLAPESVTLPVQLVLWQNGPLEGGFSGNGTLTVKIVTTWMVMSITSPVVQLSASTLVTTMNSHFDTGQSFQVTGMPMLTEAFQNARIASKISEAIQ